MLSHHRRRLSTASAARALARLAPYDVAFIRHANTGKAETDLQRALTSKGERQCAAAASAYMKGLPAPLSPFLVTSPAMRARDTATRVAPGTEHVELQCVYDGMLQPGASEAFKTLGYASLHEYMSHSNEVREMLKEHAEQVIAGLGAIVTVRAALDATDGRRPIANDQRQTLCCFGHSVYLGAAALHLADLRAHPSSVKEAIMHNTTAEVCGFWVGGITSELLKFDDV